jgi:hypothetical protein
MYSKFPLGRLVATPGAISFLDSKGLDFSPYLQRHLRGDWGDLSEDDIQANERAVQGGDRLLSSYLVDGSDKIWIITERDRSVTTILLPEEY